MTKLFEAKLLSLVKETVRKATEGNLEVWLNGKQLTEQFACFTEDWQKKYGSTLPRTQAIVDGEHASRWIYPRNKIQHMIESGEIKELTTK